MPPLKRTHFFAGLARASLACLLGGAASWAQAQAVYLSGIMGDKALLVIDGAPPSLLAVGSSQSGVKLLALDKAQQQVSIEAAGQRSTLRIGDLPISVGAGLGNSGGGRFITIPVGNSGHFVTDGFINGRSVKFMVDTGASFVVIGRAEADRLGLNYKNSSEAPIQIRTANGVAKAYPIRLQRLRIGEVELQQVEAIVGPDIPYILLGNTFLSSFRMERSNDIMRLERTR